MWRTAPYLEDAQWLRAALVPPPDNPAFCRPETVACTRPLPQPVHAYR